MFRSYLNEISRGRYKSEKQKNSLENAIELFNDFSSVVSDAKYKTIHRKGIPDMSTRVGCGQVVKDSEPKVSDHSNLKISSLKQMLQRLPIAIAEVKQLIYLKTY